METLFYWLYLFATACAFIFIWGIIEDLWRHRTRNRESNHSPLRIKPPRRARSARGYDSPEVCQQDSLLRRDGGVNLEERIDLTSSIPHENFEGGFARVCRRRSVG